MFTLSKTTFLIAYQNFKYFKIIKKKLNNFYI